jgi:hypothetical protein
VNMQYARSWDFKKCRVTDPGPAQPVTARARDTGRCGSGPIGS